MTVRKKQRIICGMFVVILEQCEVGGEFEVAGVVSSEAIARMFRCVDPENRRYRTAYVDDANLIVKMREEKWLAEVINGVSVARS